MRRNVNYTQKGTADTLLGAASEDIMPSTEREYASKVHGLGFEWKAKSQLRAYFLGSNRDMGSEIPNLEPVGCPGNSGSS